MSYSNAESEASKAARLAAGASGVSDDRAVNELADAVAHLAKAVGEIARQLKNDQ